MKKALVVLLAVASLLLTSCAISPEPEEEGFTAAFTVEIVSQGPRPTAAVRALEVADSYTWSFYQKDATVPPYVIEGTTPYAAYTWPEVGAYVIALTATRAGGGSGSNDDDGAGCCGPGPGPGSGGSGGTSGESVTASSFRVVKFEGCNNLVPILVFSTWQGGYITDFFYPGQRACINARESIGTKLTYRIEIVRVVSIDDPRPIPYPWARDTNGDGEPDEVEYIVTEDPLYCFYMPGPGGCSGETWTFRVTLRIRDADWNEATVTKFIYSGCCP